MKHIKLFEAFNQDTVWSPRNIERIRLGEVQDLDAKKVIDYMDWGPNGDLNLNLSKLESLPDGLEVDGDLDLAFSDIKSLPNKLIVRGRLNLTGTQIKEFPNQLNVEGDILLSKTPISSSGINSAEVLELVRSKGGWLNGMIYLGKS